MVGVVRNMALMDIIILAANHNFVEFQEALQEKALLESENALSKLITMNLTQLNKNSVLR